MSLSKFELNAVRDLGEKIGYGNLMCIASALWRKKLTDQGVPGEGATVPALLLYIKPEDLKHVTEECAHYDVLIAEAGSSCVDNSTSSLHGIIESRLASTGYCYRWEFVCDKCLHISLSGVDPSENELSVCRSVGALFRDMPSVKVFIDVIDYLSLDKQ